MFQGRKKKGQPAFMATDLIQCGTGHISFFGPLNILHCFHSLRKVTTCSNSDQKKAVFKTKLRSIFDGRSPYSQQIGKAFIILALYQQNQKRILHLNRQQSMQKILLEMEYYMSNFIDLEKKTDGKGKQTTEIAYWHSMLYV